MNITLVKIVVGSIIMGSSWIPGQNELGLGEKITFLKFNVNILWKSYDRRLGEAWVSGVFLPF